jgi:hypothetical protein
MYFNAVGDDQELFLNLHGVEDIKSSWYEAFVAENSKTAHRQFDPAETLRYMQVVDRYITEEAWLLQFSYPRRHILVKPWVKVFPRSAMLGYWNYLVMMPHD